MPEFTHKIGDALYDLFEDPDGQAASFVKVYPIARITPQFVYVHGASRWEHERTYRFSLSDLEADGRAWNRRHRLLLHTRPMPDWPFLVVDIRKPETLALTGSPDA